MVAIEITETNKEKNSPWHPFVAQGAVGSFIKRAQIPTAWWGAKKIDCAYQHKTNLHIQDGWAPFIEPVIQDPANYKKTAQIIKVLSGNTLVNYTYQVVEKTQTEKDAFAQEQANAPLMDEYNNYLKRQQDGVEAYMMQSAKIRLAKLQGGITQAEHEIIEEALRPVRDEVIAGQWITAKEILESIGAATIGATLYNDLHTQIVDYITANY